MTNFSNRNIKTSDDLCCHLMTPCWPDRPYHLSLPQIKLLHFMEIVNIEAGTFREIITSIQQLKEKLENIKGRQTSKSLDDWMDNQEVCLALNISQRTLQAMRSNGTLPFSKIDRKTYYRRQDVIGLIGKGKKR